MIAINNIDNKMICGNIFVNDINENNQSEMDQLTISEVKEEINDNDNDNMDSDIQNEINEMDKNMNMIELEMDNDNEEETNTHSELMKNKQFEEKYNKKIDEKIECDNDMHREELD
eukprot:230494_1